MKICPHCKNEFIGGTSFGAHITNCKLNPGRKERIEKQRESKRIPKKKFKSHCKKCDNLYEIEISQINFDKGNYKKFCSRKCANSRGPRTEECKEKIRKKLEGVNRGGKKYFCLDCEKPLRRKSKWGSCRKCLYKNDEYKKVLSIALKGINKGSKNGMFGVSPKHTKPILVFSKKHTKDENFKVRSSYEKKYVDVINNDPSIYSFTYEPKKFQTFYIDSSMNERSYQPDFLINDNLIIEIKNGWNVTLPETKEKEIAFKNKHKIKYKIITF